MNANLDFNKNDFVYNVLGRYDVHSTVVENSVDMWETSKVELISKIGGDMVKIPIIQSEKQSAAIAMDNIFSDDKAGQYSFGNLKIQEGNYTFHIMISNHKQLQNILENKFEGNLRPIISIYPRKKATSKLLKLRSRFWTDFYDNKKDSEIGFEPAFFVDMEEYTEEEKQRVYKLRKKVKQQVKLNKVVRMLLVAAEVEPEVIEKILGALSQLQSEFKSSTAKLEDKYDLVVSANPYDFVTMSDNGYNWSSCFDLSEENENNLAPFGYMADKYSALVYLTPKNRKFEFHDTEVNDKKVRALIHFSKDFQSYVVGVVYPSSNFLTEIVIESLKAYFGVKSEESRYLEDISLGSYSDVEHSFNTVYYIGEEAKESEFGDVGYSFCPYCGEIGFLYDEDYEHYECGDCGCSSYDRSTNNYNL